MKNLLLLLALTLPIHAQTASSLAKTVDAHYNHLTSLQARYTERYIGMGQDRTETGTLTLKKPGHMRWAYDSPPGKLFLLDGKSAIFYTPGDVQAQRIPAKQLDDLRSPLRFLLGHTELAKELDHLTLTLVEGGYTLSGVPRGMQQRLHSLALTVDATGAIHSMRLEEIDGATTTFTFSALHENIPTRAADFIFTPPPGVAIVTGAAPI
ncbi:MAG: outer membrane lipoprotein carrier protein LolA [Acidobacteriota bacterium]|nr:outer membrane lipoprotein carrier protein LolA [Acidobacteriota bacterium]